MSEEDFPRVVIFLRRRRLLTSEGEKYDVHDDRNLIDDDDDDEGDNEPPGKMRAHQEKDTITSNDKSNKQDSASANTRGESMSKFGLLFTKTSTHTHTHTRRAAINRTKHFVFNFVRGRLSRLSRNVYR